MCNTRERWRLIDSGLCEPAYTGAADEAIARARAAGEVQTTLHFYTRKTPTISMGYFEKVGESVNLPLCKRDGVFILRRVSGGSAIYTDKGQIIYALIGLAKEFPHNVNESYGRICSAVIRGLAHLGIGADFKPINDVQIDGKKVSGSAQLRKWGALLQHGTMILELDRERMFSYLRINREKLEKQGVNRPQDRVTSLYEATGRRFSRGEVVTALVKGFEDEFGVEIAAGELTEWERNEIGRLIEEKYGNDDWNYKR